MATKATGTNEIMAEINRSAELASIARAAMDAAKARGDNWADAVAAALRDAGFTTLDPVAFGAERDPRMVAVVELPDGVTGIWKHDTGAWRVEVIEPYEPVALVPCGCGGACMLCDDAGMVRP